MPWVKILRPMNVLMLAVSQVLTLWKWTETPISFWIIWIAVSSLSAAAGYIWNDHFDIVADRINKPSKVYIDQMPHGWGLKYGYVLSSLAIFMSVWGGWQVFVCVFFMNGILYAYAKYIKKMGVLGNCTVVFLLCVSYLGCFYPHFQIPNYAWILLLSMSVAHLMREIIKDAEDMLGDQQIGVQSIALRYGEHTTQRICISIGCLFLSMHVLFLLNLLNSSKMYPSIWVCVLASLMGYITLSIRRVKVQKDYSHISSLLKLYLTLGMGLYFVL